MTLSEIRERAIAPALESWPAVPELSPEARQGETRDLCSPTCLQKWNEKAEQWRQRLSDVE